MKKKILLLSLFLGPLAFFLFLATGDYEHKKSPIFTNKVIDVKQFDSISFYNKINIVMFYGNKPLSKEIQTFNYNEVVFKNIAKYKNFQTVTIYEKNASADIEKLKKQLQPKAGEKFYKWKFVGLSEEEINTVFKSFKTEFNLDNDLSLNYAFIIDKNAALRGRDDDDEVKGGIIKGYDMLSVNDLKNKLLDDTKNIFYQFNPGAKSRAERLKGK